MSPAGGRDRFPRRPLAKRSEYGSSHRSFIPGMEDFAVCQKLRRPLSRVRFPGLRSSGPGQGTHLAGRAFPVPGRISFWEVISLPVHYGPLLRTLHFCMDQAMTNTLEKLDLTGSQGHLLGYLVHHPDPPCPKDIEKCFHLSHPTVSGLLSRLEKKGFIELRPDEQDRRCKRIYLLPKGKACQEAMDCSIQETERRMVQDFTPQEQALFLAFLQRAIHNMGGRTHHCHHKEEPNE